MSAGGGQEIHYDSSVMRAEFNANGGGGQPLDITDPAYVPQIVAPSAGALAETLPPDILEAMATGKPLTPDAIRQIQEIQLQNRIAAQTPSGHVQRQLPPPAVPQMGIPQMVLPQFGVVELTIPVGGMIARVLFNGQPSAKHWKRLIRHLEIEADPTYEEDDRDEQEEQRLAEERHLAGIRAEANEFAQMEIRRRGDDLSRPENGESQPVVPRSVKRRKRKDDGATAES